MKMRVALILLALALIKDGDSFPSVEKDPVGAIDTADDRQAGRVLTRTKRNSLQFGAMIWCKVGRNPLDYNNYGCLCRAGGNGKPVDEIDRCCEIHDRCYDDIIDRDTCDTKTTAMLYFITYWRDGCTGCVREASWWFLGNTSCQKALCECDGAAARCFKEYDSKFKNQYKNYDHSNC